MKTYLKAFRLKRFWLLLLLPAAFLLDFAARQSADFAEWYAVTIYPVYAQFFSAITGVFPFSVGEFCLIALVLFILAYLIHGVYKLIRHKEGRFAYFVRFLSVPVLIATCIAFLCVTNYGTNHRRYSFAAVSGLTVRESSAKELYDVCAYLINEANTLRENLPEDENGVFQLSNDVFLDADEAKSSFNSLHDTYSTLYTNGKPKPVLFSEVMSYLDISGIYCPFTFEANVIAFLACLQSDDPKFRYSGVYLASVHAMNALLTVDSDLWNRADALKSDALRRDIRSNNAYWKQYETPVSEVSDRVNDAYLKANGQENGLRSYGRMVDLLLAYYRDEL